MVQIRFRSLSYTGNICPCCSIASIILHTIHPALFGKLGGWKKAADAKNGMIVKQYTVWTRALKGWSSIGLEKRNKKPA